MSVYHCAGVRYKLEFKPFVMSAMDLQWKQCNPFVIKTKGKFKVFDMVTLN